VQLGRNLLAVTTRNLWFDQRVFKVSAACSLGKTTLIGSAARDKAWTANVFRRGLLGLLQNDAYWIPMPIAADVPNGRLSSGSSKPCCYPHANSKFPASCRSFWCAVRFRVGLQPTESSQRASSSFRRSIQNSAVNERRVLRGDAASLFGNPFSKTIKSCIMIFVLAVDVKRTWLPKLGDAGWMI
jgi:hypothetical protein